MNKEKNMEKYEIYRSMHDNLNKAMKNGFYYEAIFIEYAILEDRLTSVLKYAGVPYVDRKGNDITITHKIGKIENREEFDTKFIRERLTPNMMKQLRDWLQKRNDFIHKLARIPYDNDAVKAVAEEGNELVKTISNKSKSVVNRLRKEGQLS